MKTKIYKGLYEKLGSGQLGKENLYCKLLTNNMEKSNLKEKKLDASWEVENGSINLKSQDLKWDKISPWETCVLQFAIIYDESGKNLFHIDFGQSVTLNDGDTITLNFDDNNILNVGGDMYFDDIKIDEIDKKENLLPEELFEI